ncbi:MAG: S1/P1 nuclease [Pseudomonadota bacterium]
MKYAYSKVIIAAASLCVLVSPNALAFGDEGHKIVAGIAYVHLDGPVRKKIDGLLASDKDTLTTPDFMARATWADKYRDSDRRSTKERYNATHLWHFVDIETDSPDIDKACNNHPALPTNTVASAGDPNDCVLDKIEQFTSELKDPSTKKAEKILALKFIMHFVGDIHQPLHSADHSDRGGNSVPVLYRNKTVPDNLHAYWDTELVKRLGSDPKTVATSLGSTISKSQIRDWSKGTVADWATESFQLAKDVAYNFSGETTKADDHGTDAMYLDAAYDSRALPVVKTQLSKAGIRLAKILNESLK